MAHYRFELHFLGNVEAVIDALYEAGWDDAGVSGDHRGGSAEFVREATSAIAAVTSAIEQAERCGLEVTGVTEDLVTLADIAERTGRTLAAVDLWVRGRRGPGDFPAPRVPRARAAMFSWAEVATWLSDAGLIDVDETTVEMARSCALIDSALRTRRGLRQVPPDERHRVACLVA
jgi:hypothetical protein